MPILLSCSHILKGVQVCPLRPSTSPFKITGSLQKTVMDQRLLYRSEDVFYDTYLAMN